MDLSKIPGVSADPQAGYANDRGRWIVYGRNGSGKTTFASTIARSQKTLYIDLPGEKGTRSFAGSKYADNIVVSRPTTMEEMEALLYLLTGQDHDFGAVVVDSITALSKMTLRYHRGFTQATARKLKEMTEKATLPMYGSTTQNLNDIALFWFALADGTRPNPMHVVMTSQEKTVEVDGLGVMERTIDVQNGSRSAFLSTADYVVYAATEENEEAQFNPSAPPVKHIVRFGAAPGYATKGRVSLDGPKIPSVMGRKSPPDLTNLSYSLGIPGSQPLN